MCNKISFFSIFLVLFPFLGRAATAPVATMASNSYMFVENNVDGEFFVTPLVLEPRFTGANAWTKYPTKQDSLGYMGRGAARTNRYADLWISNSPINTPFSGLRCRIDGKNCPSKGYINADITDSEGIYHVRTGNSVANGNQPYGSFSPAAYNYFREQAVGSSTTFNLNWCALKTTTADYDYISGVRCKDLPDSGVYWEAISLTATKIGHLSLHKTGAISEIFIASDGTPSIADGSIWCSTGIAGSATGIICKMVSYNLQNTATFSSLVVDLVPDTSILKFTPAASDIKISGDGSSWYNYTADTSFEKIFTPSGKFVLVFFSKSFFMKVLKYGGDLTGKDSLFTFSFMNRNTPQSGYYQFTSSNQVSIVPKEYGISIISDDYHSHPENSGIIGSETPISFQYQITTSASRQADNITAQVIGDSVDIKSRPYCLFSSSNRTLSVPVPAYISFTSKSGSVVRKRNSCSEQPVNITDADWIQTPWDNAAADTGYYYKTKIKLLFPMDDSRSQFTVAGDDWLGVVSASGEIKVTATWLGVN